MNKKQTKNLLSRALHHFFIDGFSAMAQGLFCTLIVGTILGQIATILLGLAADMTGTFAEALDLIGTLLNGVAGLAKILTGAGIGVATASRFKRAPMVMVSAAVAGLIGAFAAQILAGNVIVAANAQSFLLVDPQTMESANMLEVSPLPGEPLGAFLAAFAAEEVGALVSGRTKLDILVTPLVTILSGAAVGLLVSPPVSAFMNSLGSTIMWYTDKHPVLMGIVIAVLMGLALTLPISSAALGVSLNLGGLAAGAAVVGCAAQMVGFAVASYRENKFSGLISQGLGTSMLQIPNIMRHPQIWVPATLTSAIIGPLATTVFGMTCTSTGAGMGTSGLVGPIMTFQSMTAAGGDALTTLLSIALLQFVLPAVLALGISEAMRKLGWIKRGWMKLD